MSHYCCTSKKHSNWEITRKNLCTHVTALKTFANFLLIAEGNQVSLLSLLTKKILETEVVFVNSSIHGIRSDDHYKFMFFGSKSLKLYTCEPARSKCFTSLSSEIFLCDWIHDAQWLSSWGESSDSIAVIFAHNSVTVMDIENPTVLKNTQCAENCILYTASIISDFEECLVVAVGTVFQQILIWSPNSKSETTVKKPFHCLEGHQGVIFSISYNKFLKLISSTSDDRSIRLWKICSTIASEDYTALEYWEKAIISPSHVLYAHESRVWKSTILDKCIISVGEDSAICFWDMDGHLLKKKKCHKNGSIWCLETNYSLHEMLNLDRNYTAFTGGSDGGVCCWDLQNTLNGGYVSEISLHNGSTKHDFPRVVSILHSKKNPRLMTTTDRGWLSFYDMNANILKDISYDVSFVSYCISAVSINGHIALGNLTGDLALLSYNGDIFYKPEVEKFKIHSSKVFSLHWVDRSGEHLLSCGTSGYLTLWKVYFKDSGCILTKMNELHLPKCNPHWWSTCATSVDSTKSLIVGDRGGSIHFYTLIDDFKQRIEPSTTHKYIHGENGVTDIQEHHSLIYSAGRDGRVLLYSINEGSLIFLHNIKVSHNLEWIGKMFFYKTHLLLLGFHTKYFVVWSTELESTVMSVDCGGGHRSWDFHLTENCQATFIAIKKKDIMFAKEDLHFSLNKSVIKAGVSGLEFCQTCFLFTTEVDGFKNMSVLAAGGEDNSLRIIGVIDDKSEHSQIEVLHSLAGHLSSIRSLAKTKMSEENAFLLASVGGRAQVILWKVTNDSTVMLEQLASHILFSFERKAKKPWKESQDVQVDPQTRLMDVKLCKSCLNGTESYTVALACSDSYFRVYSFDVSEKNLDLLYDVQPSEHCNLKISFIQSTQDLNESMFYLIASTDGILNFMNHNDMKARLALQSLETKPVINESLFQIKLHQSGINALDVKHLFEETWLICTAGDDNALSVMAVEIYSDLTAGSFVKILTKTEVLNAHASQITGLKFISSETIVSVSIDQRFNLWKWSFESNSLIVTLTTSRVSLIPDISNLECWENENGAWTAVLCGEGIEILCLKDIL